MQQIIIGGSMISVYIQPKLRKMFYCLFVLVISLFLFTIQGYAITGFNNGIMENIASNVSTDFNRSISSPIIDQTTFLHPLASVIGNVTLCSEIMVSPCASVRADEGQPIFVGDGSNIQDSVILHALETEGQLNGEWEYVENRQFDENGNRVSNGSGFGIFIGVESSLAHQVQIHGPAYIGNNTFIGMQALIFNSKVGSHCVIEPGCTLIGVDIPDGMYVPAGSVLTTQADVDSYAHDIDWDTYAYSGTNHAVVEVNKALAAGYLAVGGPLGHIASNVLTNFSRMVYYPVIPSDSFVHPLASVIGNVTLESEVMVSPGASIRGDEGQPMYVGFASNVQDGVVIHGLETEEFHDGNWHYIENRQFDIYGNRVSDGSGYCVYIGDESSMAHQTQIHGPAYVGHNTFVGMQSLIFNAKIGSHCVVEPGCTIIGVEIDDEMYVPAGSVVTTPDDVANLVQPIDWGSYSYGGTNDAVVHVNRELAAGYLAVGTTLNHIAPNVLTGFSSTISTPVIGFNSFVHPNASVIGNVTLGMEIFVAPSASVRGDEGQPIFIGRWSNIQDGVVIHGLETEEFDAGQWHYLANRQFDEDGNHVSDGSGYSVHIGEEVSLAHQAQIHGPVYIGDNTFIGMQSLIFNAKVGSNCVIEPGCTIIGVEIEDGKYVPAGSVVTCACDVASLAQVIDWNTYGYRATNEAVVHVNRSLARGYNDAVDQSSRPDWLGMYQQMNSLYTSLTLFNYLSTINPAMVLSANNWLQQIHFPQMRRATFQTYYMNPLNTTFFQFGPFSQPFSSIIPYTTTFNLFRPMGYYNATYSLGTNLSFLPNPFYLLDY